MPPSLKCVGCDKYLFDQPMQCPCGDRLCGVCYNKYKSSNATKIICPLCQTDFLLEDCFRDRAATMELKKAILKCDECPWEGKSDKYEEHKKTCKIKIPKSETNDRAPQKCECVYGQEHPTLKCGTPGCLWEGKSAEKYEAHMQTCESQLPKSETSLMPQMSKYVYHNKNQEDERECCQSKVQDKEEINQPTVEVQAGSTLQQSQEMVQTLPSTSHDGVFIWKIPEIKRRRQEAKMGKTISLYSTPFYTSRHGYKMCLRLYMDGDGSGKGTHLSFFLVVMKGECDAILSWPFQPTFKLMLLDQDKQKDIAQSFKPDPSSSSFQRPRNEMNVASGCPMFAPLAVLQKSYVKDDIMFLKCTIDTTNAE